MVVSVEEKARIEGEKKATRREAKRRRGEKTP